jgi:tetratricopeptide (TPR) repeat protein
VDLNPEFVEGWIQLGDIMTTMRNPLAIQYYKNAIRLDSNNIETLHNYAYSLQIFGKEQEAINQYLINIQKRPDYELSLYNLGIMYQKKDSCEKAIDYLSRAIALNSKEASSYYYRARCYTKINQADKASEDLKTALNLYPEYYEARKMLSELRK